MKKRILSLILALCLLCSLLLVPAFAAEEIASGTCGENLTWTLTEDGTLTISGSGAMYGYSDSNVPWRSYLGEITNLILPDGLTEISNYAFYHCTGLSAVDIPQSVVKIGQMAFGGCNCQLYYPGTTEQWLSINFCVSGNYWSGYGAVCSDGTVVTCGECGSQVNYALYGDGSFAVTGTGAMEFYKNLSNSSHWSGYVDEIKTVSIQEGVTSIDDYAFKGCKNLTAVTIPSSVTTIGYYAFSNCSSLPGVTLPASVKYIGKYAFKYCTSLTSMTIPSSVADVRDGAFFGCSSLTDIALPITVTSIGDEAFQYCSSLTGITIPSGVTSIGKQAFYGCSSLAELVIPKSVTSIGIYAFSGCSSLTSIMFCGNAPTIGSDAFNSVTATASYPSGNETWTNAVMQNYGGTITWTALEHPYTSEVTAPTCTGQGYTTHTCTVCGDSYVDSYVDPLGHQTELKNAREATCTDILPILALSAVTATLITRLTPPAIPRSSTQRLNLPVRKPA